MRTMLAMAVLLGALMCEACGEVAAGLAPTALPRPAGQAGSER